MPEWLTISSRVIWIDFRLNRRKWKCVDTILSSCSRLGGYWWIPSGCSSISDYIYGYLRYVSSINLMILCVGFWKGNIKTFLSEYLIEKLEIIFQNFMYFPWETIKYSIRVTGIIACTKSSQIESIIIFFLMWEESHNLVVKTKT